MFGFAVGLLTEYATGSDLVDQVKILLSNFGILDLEWGIYSMSNRNSDCCNYYSLFNYILFVILLSNMFDFQSLSLVYSMLYLLHYTAKVEKVHELSFLSCVAYSIGIDFALHFLFCDLQLNAEIKWKNN